MKLEVNCDYNESKSKQPLYKDISNSNPDFTLEQRSLEYIEKPNIRIYCSGCELELTRSICLITKTDYYCVACFANLDEFPQEYLVRSSLRKSFNETQWDLMDEAVLAAAFRIWGYSNWAQIKEYMDYNQSPFSLAQIEQHFEQYHYFQPDNLIQVPQTLTPALPHTPYGEMALKAYEKVSFSEVNFKRSDSKCEKKPSSFRSFAGQNEQRGLKPSSMAELLPSQAEGRHLSSNLKKESSILGYNAKRNEFQVCYYDLEAQKMLDDLEFYQTDTPEEIGIKLEMIEEYNRRLDERAKRRDFVLQYKLLDSQYQFAQKQEEQKAAIIFRPFMRFTASHEEYLSLLNNFAELTVHQNVMTNLRKMRSIVSEEGDLESAHTYMTRKRKKYVQNWERTYQNSFQDKRRRKIYKKTNLNDGSIVLQEDNEHMQACPIPIEDIEGGLRDLFISGSNSTGKLRMRQLNDFEKKIGEPQSIGQ